MPNRQGTAVRRPAFEYRWAQWVSAGIYDRPAIDPVRLPLERLTVDALSRKDALPVVMLDFFDLTDQVSRIDNSIFFGSFPV